MLRDKGERNMSMRKYAAQSPERAKSPNLRKPPCPRYSRVLVQRPLPQALRACVQSTRDLPLSVYAPRAPFPNQAVGCVVRRASLLTALCEVLGDLCLRTLVRREMERLENLRVSARGYRLCSAQIMPEIDPCSQVKLRLFWRSYS